MCEPVTIGLMAAATLVTAGSQIYAGQAASNMAKYEGAVALENRKHELAAAQDAKQRHITDQMRHWRRVSQMLGQQRATGAAHGLDVNFGSMADLQDDTMMIGLEDSAILGRNLEKEVKGFDINAANYTMQSRGANARAKAAKTGAYMSAFGTILGGASQIASFTARPATPGGG
jgi:hypothetical protein